MPDVARSPFRPPVTLNPARWPVRWRVAAGTAALTFVVLLVFAVAVGELVSHRLTSDFREDVQATARGLAVRAKDDPETELTSAIGQLVNPGTTAALIVGGEIRVARPNYPLPGPPLRTGVTRYGGFEFATQVAVQGDDFTPTKIVQFGRSYKSLDEQIDRIWLFLILGAIGGTALAALAGIAIAKRAMRPVSSLTTAAREIAVTRDPSRHLPLPQTGDEVAELAQTLERMLQELDRAQEETEQMMQAQREFVADASHELRTPLTSILANLEILQHRTAAEEGRAEEADAVASALRSSRRMIRLVADLLLLARADAGRVSERRQCDLAAIAAAAVAEIEPVADGHPLALATEGPVPITANADELHRVVINLLDNSLRHTPSGTAIEVAVERRNGHAVLEVNDDGPGIPAGMERQIFARFVRGSGPADRDPGGGSGLGLAIVQAVATSHGGEVEAGPSRQGGARFTIRLPLRD